MLALSGIQAGTNSAVDALFAIVFSLILFNAVLASSLLSRLRGCIVLLSGIHMLFVDYSALLQLCFTL